MIRTGWLTAPAMGTPQEIERWLDSHRCHPLQTIEKARHLTCTGKRMAQQTQAASRTKLAECVVPPARDVAIGEDHTAVVRAQSKQRQGCADDNAHWRLCVSGGAIPQL